MCVVRTSINISFGVAKNVYNRELVVRILQVHERTIEIGRATEVRITERMIERDREKGMPGARYACGKIDMKTERRGDMETERQSYREGGIHIDRGKHIHGDNVT